jgi:sugar/nucleoside kinase (ribokinase family)
MDSLSRPDSLSQPDYLIIGHVTQDLTPEGTVIGGTASYAGMTAQALGCRTAVLTSAGPEFDPGQQLPGLSVHCIPAEQTTTFENIYTETGRRQRIQGLANPISFEELPAAWRHAPIVHLAPVAGEFEPANAIQNLANNQVGITPQGWLRKWDEAGYVSYTSWPADPAVLSLTAVLILSDEDLPDEQAMLTYRQLVSILVQTKGRKGCTVFAGGQVRDFPAPALQEVNPTGAGDIFAAAYFIRLHQTKGNPWEAARFANQIAAWSVTQRTLPEKMEAIKRMIQE